MIYTEYQQVLLTQLQNNDKRIEEIKKEQEEIQNMFLQESEFTQERRFPRIKG